MDSVYGTYKQCNDNYKTYLIGSIRSLLFSTLSDITTKTCALTVSKDIDLCYTERMCKW